MAFEPRTSRTVGTYLRFLPLVLGWAVEYGSGTGDSHDPAACDHPAQYRYLAFFMTSDAPIKELAALLGQDEIRPSFTSSDASGKDSEDKPPSFLSAN